MLISSHGYNFTVRRSKNDFTYWVCGVRNKKVRCPAWVKQYGETFVEGGQGHLHAANPGIGTKVKVSTKAKKVAREQIHLAASEIVEKAMVEFKNQRPNPPNPDNIIRATNLHRQKLRPAEPGDDDLFFTINGDYIHSDEFLVDDIRVGEQRHLLFARTTQLQHLAVARRWFMDGTFKVVRRPFYQLLSVHTFVRSGDNAKQVPLLFALMSRRTKQDYVAVLNALKERLGDLMVEWVMLDFEAAAWQAVREVLPHTVVKGCAFHWGQRLYRKITQLGLATAYMEREGVYHFLRKVMALPYLPAEHVRPAFNTLRDQAEESGSERVLALVNYVGSTWIDGRVWRPENWSVFLETVRTNNDVEGWHRRLNTRAGGAQLPFYVLVPLLYGEAQYLDIQVRLVSANILHRLHRKQYRKTHEALFKAWEAYEEDEMTTSQLLKTVSHISGLGPVTTSLDYTEDE